MQEEKPKKELNLQTPSKITWCPGCPNSAILVAFRQLVSEMVSAGKVLPENIVVGSGIGCHGKITDYLNLNSFTSLHGRLIPSLTGMKCANPKLTIVGFSGDGDSYSEGLEHLFAAARRNSDVNLFIHNNQVFALTTGQATSVSPKGFRGKSTPFGSIEEPWNPLLALLSAGATFIARAYAPDIAGTKKIMSAAIAHKGFSFVDIIQPCLTFLDTRDFFKERTYWLPDDYDSSDYLAAQKILTELGEVHSTRVPLGIFYSAEKPTFEEKINK
jgi:2-oxoglutarate ferredoxin oxidoreductase subunit beta